NLDIMKIDERERTTGYNTGLAKVAVQCSADTFVVNQSLVLRINISGENRHLRQARKRSEEIPSGFPRYGSGLHTSSTALRDCPRTWVSRKRETCVKPRAVANHYKNKKIYYVEPT